MASSRLTVPPFAPRDGLALPDVIPVLAAAMTENPKLQVLALNGYHDLVTPFLPR
jgi:hypothetical protein